MHDAEHLYGGGGGNPLRSRSAKRALRFPAPIAALLLSIIVAACSPPPTPTPTATPTATSTPTATPTPTATAAPTATATPIPTPTATPTPTPTPTPTATPAPTAAPTPAATPTFTPVPTLTPTPEPGTPSPTPTPRIIASLAAPGGVEASAADRNLIVSWSPVAGAAGYVVAARFANGVEPFEWSEYNAAASPYVIADNWAGMSGLEYEIRAASVSAEGRSEWSPAVTATAPQLLPAPAGAIGSTGLGYQAEGWDKEVHLRAQRPFTRRSPFVWSVCEVDGSRCELLPITQPTHTYRFPEAARGKRVHVQVDYDKNGLSYTALATVGVVNPEEAPRPPTPRPSIPDGCEGAPSPSGDDEFTQDAALFTHLHYVESKSVQVAWDKASGGAVEPLCNDLLVVTPWGRMALARSNGAAQPIDGQVPMNIAGMRAYLLDHAYFSRFATFRVADILLRQRTREAWELYATHHYFTGECIRFRVSAAEIRLDGGSVSVSPTWRTVFDAEPCLPPPLWYGREAGGRMLTDGPDHLLIVIGHHGHGNESLAQDPASHLGKLVRVAIESGEAEILASGLRNPQGLARDADGALWSTEHGPQGGDELNLLQPGRDYGWPSVSYGVEYGGYALQNDDAGGHEGFAKPRFAWVPAIAVSALIINDERQFPLWKDDLLAGSLAAQSLFRIRLDGANVQYVERIEVGYRIRDLALMPDGRIALLADGGRAHFLSRFVERCDERDWPLRLVYGLHCYSPEDEEAADMQEGGAPPAGPGGG